MSQERSRSVDVSVVIPTYRGRESLEALLGELKSLFDARGDSAEFVVVDDCSPDGTWEYLQKASDRLPELRALRLQANIGQMGATLCGIAHSTGKVVVTMDDDLQHPPSEVPKLLAALEASTDWDVVVGAWPRGNDGLFRRVGGQAFEYLQNLAVPKGKRLRHTGFRALRRPVADALIEHETRHPVLSSLILEVADSVHNIDVEHQPRHHGASNFSLRKAIRLTIDNVVQASTLPLRWISTFGFSVAAIAAVTGAVYTVRAIMGVATPPGWVSSFLAIVFFGGAILGTIGLLGRYMAVIMNEVRRPPRWVVRDRIH